MITRILISCYLFLSLSLCFAQVKELDDVEISGPSNLNSTLSKKPLVKPILPVLAKSDSLPLVLPLKDNEPIKAIPHPRHFVSTFDINNRLSGQQHLLMSLPGKLVSAGNLDNTYYSPHKNWNLYNGAMGLDFSLGSYLLQSRGGYFQSETPLSAEFHSVQSRLDTPNTRSQQSELSGKEFDLGISTLRGTFLPATLEFQSEYLELKPWHKKSAPNTIRAYWNNQFRLRDYLIGKLQLNLHVAAVDKTTLVSVNLARNPFLTPKRKNPLSSISVVASQRRMIPMAELNFEKDITYRTQIAFTQRPEYNISNSYKVYSTMPWQSNPLNNPLSIAPLNFLSRLTYRNRISEKESRMFAFTARVQYIVDEQSITSDDISYLPITRSHQVWQAETGFMAQSVYQHLTLSQELMVQKGWLADHNNIDKPYLPLYSFTTKIAYNKPPHSLLVSLEQDYSIRDERGQLLRAAIELDAKYTRQLSKISAFYLGLENALDRGKIIHSSLPSQPASVNAGLTYIF